MKRIAIIIAALASCLVMSAQDVKVKSRVELKGGKADVVGYAELQADGGYVVETESGDVFYYSAAEIKKVTQLEAEKVSDSKVKIEKAKISYDFSSDRSKNRGYMGIIEAGIGLNSYQCGSQDYNYGEITMETSVVFINGYRFSPHFYAGVGIGFNNTFNDFSLPLFLHLRSEFTKKRTSPYVALSGGVTIPYSNDTGIFLEGAFGFRTHLKKHGSIWYGLSAGCVSESWEDYYSNAVLMCFKLAYSF